MACFSLLWLENFLVWFLIVCFIVAVVRLIVPAIMGWFSNPPGADVVMTVLWWLIGLILAIYLVILIFDLIGCLTGGASLSFPLRGVR